MLRATNHAGLFQAAHALSCMLCHTDTVGGLLKNRLVSHRYAEPMSLVFGVKDTYACFALLCNPASPGFSHHMHRLLNSSMPTFEKPCQVNSD